jgi:hypothetical protein
LSIQEEAAAAEAAKRKTLQPRPSMLGRVMSMVGPNAQYGAGKGDRDFAEDDAQPGDIDYEYTMCLMQWFSCLRPRKDNTHMTRVSYERQVSRNVAAAARQNEYSEKVERARLNATAVEPVLEADDEEEDDDSDSDSDSDTDDDTLSGSGDSASSHKSQSDSSLGIHTSGIRSSGITTELGSAMASASSAGKTNRNRTGTTASNTHKNRNSTNTMRSSLSSYPSLMSTASKVDGSDAVSRKSTAPSAPLGTSNTYVWSEESTLDIPLSVDGSGRSLTSTVVNSAGPLGPLGTSGISLVNSTSGEEELRRSSAHRSTSESSSDDDEAHIEQKVDVLAALNNMSQSSMM